ncbi:hypothetical protein M9H77_07558 [Catharanthus roseus]|uniref:Uncharacterized protein n=1 Tax=Catharanthus roseus TaxID=4058 RepID=A0ACC0BVJ5_CATRO|nr:hypothetical protein M9H77_07558 [Catharanthus roseus]
MKQALRIRCGVEKYEGQEQGQAKVNLIESAMVEESLKTHAMEEKRNVEQESFNEEQRVIESISTLLEEFECKKSFVREKQKRGDKREGMRESCCDISLPLNSLSNEVVYLLLIPSTISLLIFLHGCRNLKLKTWKMKEVLATSSTKS